MGNVSFCQICVLTFAAVFFWNGVSKIAERRVTAAASAGSIKLPSPAPVAVPVTNHAVATAAGQRSRLSHQVQLRNSPAARGRRVTTSVGPDADEDAEGEDDLEEDPMDEGGDTEDKEPYCFCRKLSYGEVRNELTSHIRSDICSFLRSSVLALSFDSFVLFPGRPHFALRIPWTRRHVCMGPGGGSAGQMFHSDGGVPFIAITHTPSGLCHRGPLIHFAHPRLFSADRIRISNPPRFERNTSRGLARWEVPGETDRQDRRRRLFVYPSILH